MPKQNARSADAEVIPYNSDSSEAAEIVRSLILNADTRKVGVRAGLRFLCANAKRFGKDAECNIIASVVVGSCNALAAKYLEEHSSIDACHHLLVDGKKVLDGYREKVKCYGDSYIADRCRCLFGLAEVLRKRKRLSESAKMLMECETLSLFDSGSPSLSTIRTCLSELLLLSGELLLARRKARSAIKFFRANLTTLSKGDWTAYRQALLIYCKVCIRLRESDEARIALESARQDSSLCPFPIIFLPMLERVGSLLPNESPLRRAQSSSPTHRLAERPTTCRSELVVIDPTDSGDRSMSLPPATTPRQYVQSGHETQRGDWIVCQSKSTGKEYFYNTRTGNSCWRKPE